LENLQQTAQSQLPSLQLAKDLMAIDSLTPNDKGCQILMTDRLKKIGFEVEL
jgi:succinyl-diaminopimelate desuccinylase